MLTNRARLLLNRRPNIRYVEPPSEDTVPEESPAELEETQAERVKALVSQLENIEKAADLVEELIVQRAKDVKVKLDCNSGEDFVTAQAAARCFPEKAVEIEPGISVVCELDFDMYKTCVQKLKAHGKEQAQKNQVQKVERVVDPLKVNFGGLDKDRRPELNQMSMPIAPINILAYLQTTIPLLFAMLLPITSLYVKGQIVGHTHVDPLSGVTGPGVPVVPV